MEKIKGILWQYDTFVDRLVTVFRYAGAGGSLFVVTYGFAVYIGIFPTDRFNLPVYVVLSILFLSVASWQLLDRQTQPLRALLRLSALHVLSLSFILLVTGFQSPLIGCWLLLFIASYFYFDRVAFYISSALLLTVAILDFFFAGQLTISYIATNLSIVAALCFVGYIVVRLGDVQALEHGAFVQTRINENLQRDRMLTIINSMGDAIINTNAQGTVVAYNAASLNLFDTNESLNGKKLDTILELKDKDGKKVPLFKEVAKRGSLMIREDLSYEFEDGELMRLSVNCSPVRTSYTAEHPPRSGYIFIMRDITKTKSLEEERDEFISVVSHELRTPITIAEGSISNVQFLLGRSVSGEQVDQALNEAHDQVLYLAKMVNDLSTLSRAERGVAAEPEEVDVEQLIRSLYHEYQSQASEKKLHLNLDIQGKIGSLFTSRLYLEETLQNFITNAIKYTEKGSITIHAKRHDESRLELTVEDSGIGISKSDQRKIFQKFYRSEDYRTRQTSGTGLGLYVVKKLTEKLGAEVIVSSRLNHGSTFGIILGNIATHTDKKEAEQA